MRFGPLARRIHLSRAYHSGEKCNITGLWTRARRPVFHGKKLLDVLRTHLTAQSTKMAARRRELLLEWSVAGVLKLFHLEEPPSALNDGRGVPPGASNDAVKQLRSLRTL